MHTFISQPKESITAFFSRPPAKDDIVLKSFKVTNIKSLCEPPKYEFSRRM
jgi:hypothetical protein